ncbi:hypothetical protein GCM10009800_53050 [Nocardiopsis rhodophaea]
MDAVQQSGVLPRIDARRQGGVKACWRHCDPIDLTGGTDHFILVGDAVEINRNREARRLSVEARGTICPFWRESPIVGRGKRHGSQAGPAGAQRGSPAAMRSPYTFFPLLRITIPLL